MGILSTNDLKWSLTQTSFDFLLTQLDEDREKAGQRYEALRLRLQYFFEARNSTSSEILVDETINRVAKKIITEQQIHNLESYALTIARYVWLESLRAATPLSLEQAFIDEEQHLPDQTQRAEEERQQQEERYAAMQKCLQTLPESAQTLLREYYQEKGGAQTERRRQLAEKYGLSENALYLKVFRLRQKLAADLRQRDERQ